MTRLDLDRRLPRLLAALPPGTELRVTDPAADPPAVEPVPTSPAALAAVAGFDWSAAAQDEWEANRNPERKQLRAAAVEAVAGNDAFLDLTNPNSAQLVAQVRRLTRQASAVIRRLVQLD